MHEPESIDPDRLLDRAQRGDPLARQQLLHQHREALRRMVVVRLDRRLASRLEASDVVQETLVVAANRLDAYLRDRPAPFLCWLRQIAQDRLTDAYRRHVVAGRRTVRREEPMGALLPDDSVGLLARRLVSSGTSPSRRLDRIEQRERVTAALAALPESDRELLIMRFIEGLGIAEIARLLEIGESAAKMRQLRALDRLRIRLGAAAGPGDSGP
jgi:RNA polymerase sigma-70 factor (ECF subfamily)